MEESSHLDDATSPDKAGASKRSARAERADTRTGRLHAAYVQGTSPAGNGGGFLRKIREERSDEAI